jgi:hypothetical protein
MPLKDYPDHRLLSEYDVLKKIKTALELKKPFSLVRIGDGENIVLAQENFLTRKEVLNSYWVKQSETGKGKGVTLPCLKLRDRMVKAIHKASVVGICRLKNDEMAAQKDLSGS